MAQIFVSHSSTDKEQAAQLLDWLHAEGFLSTFLDFDETRGFAGGDDWERRLYRELSNADAVLLILTKNWVESKWCFVEFAQARALGKIIIPLIETPTGESFICRDLQHLDLVHDRESGLARLQSRLTQIVLNTRGGFPWDHTRPPYPGLLAFDEADAAIYFGRDDDIRRLMERLNARRAHGGEKLVAVLGASGSGKSSLLRAGIAPRLKRDPHNWIVLPPFRPQTRPVDELAQSVAIALRDPDWKRRRDALARDDLQTTSADLVGEFRAIHRHNEAHLLLVIDQAEELFGGADPQQAEQFFRVLNAMLDEHLPFIAVMALRSDYLGRLQQEPTLKVGFEQFSFKPMPLERVRDVIEGPATVASLTVDNALVTAAIADAHTGDALPLLAFALRELYEQAGKSERLTIEMYRALGDETAKLSPLENAVRCKAEEVLAGAKPTTEDLQALKEAFIPSMVRVNAEGEYVRRTAAMDALPTRSRALLERLARARLLRIDETKIEVTHEALLRKWPLLRGWLDEQRDFLIGREQLEQDLLDWQRASTEQKSEALLQGLKLTRARSWLLSKHMHLSAQERDFIRASVAKQEADAALRERLRARILAGLALGLVVALLLAGLARVQKSQADERGRISFSRQLAAEAVAHLDDSLDLSLLLAIEAINTADTWEGRSALFSAIQHYPYIERYVRGQTGQHQIGARIIRHSGLAFSPDGNFFAASAGYSKDGAVLWNLTSGQFGDPIPVPHTASVIAIAFSPDSKTFVAGDLDGTANVWESATATRLASTHLCQGDFAAIEDVTFSPDGQTIAGACGSDVLLWTWREGKLRELNSKDLRNITTLAFRRDGKVLTAGGRAVDGGKDSIQSLSVSWNLSTNHQIGTPIRGLLMGAVREKGEFAFNLNGTICFRDEGSYKQVGDAITGAVTDSYQDLPLSFAISHDGKSIMFPSENNNLEIWDIASSKRIEERVGHREEVESVALSPNGVYLASLAYDDAIILWRVHGPRSLARTVVQTGEVSGLAFSPAGDYLVNGGGGRVALRDGRDATALASFPTEVVNPLFDFSSEGSLLAWYEQADLYAKSDDKTVLPFEIIDLKHRVSLLRTRDVNYGGPIAVSPNGALVAVTRNLTEVAIWKRQDGSFSETTIRRPIRITSLRFAPDGKAIAVGDQEGNVVICSGSLATSYCRDFGHLSNAMPILTLSFNSTGNHLLATSMETITLWDVPEHRRIREIAYGSGVGAPAIAAIDPSGHVLAWTTMADKSIEIMEANLGREFGPALDYAASNLGDVSGLAFLPNGRVLATSHQSEIKLWDFNVESWRHRACDIANRNLTMEEWGQYVGGSYHQTCDHNQSTENY